MAVDVDHLEIQRNTITGLIGPNGAGKTTFFNLLTGFDKPNEGSTHFNGRRVDTMSSHRRARHGMVRTFQLTKALSKLSVMDNMKLGATVADRRAFLGFARLSSVEVARTSASRLRRWSFSIGSSW